MEAGRFFKFLILLILVAQTAASEPQAVSSAAPTANDNYTFVNNRPIYLRDNSLKNYQLIPANSSITLEPQFILDTFKTAQPTREQFQRLFLNPGEFYGKIDAEPYYDPNTRDRRSDYFFPVIIKTPNGETLTGKSAMYYYNRYGLAQLQEPPPLKGPPRTEGDGTCAECPKTPSNPSNDLGAVVGAINRSSSNPLWQKYSDFAKEFAEQNPDISKSQAGYYKRFYISSLIDKFGAHDAGSILTALTGFAESPYRADRKTQIAETAAVIRVVDNRANNQYRKKSRTLRDIGVDENADTHLTNVLADWQFSSWNEKDNSLLHILQLNPETADATTMQRLTAAFDAQQMINTGSIEFVGKMNDSRVQHYHANYVVPNWAVKRKRVSAIIRVDGTEININKQHGAYHIFYDGVF